MKLSISCIFLLSVFIFCIFVLLFLIYLIWMKSVKEMNIISVEIFEKMLFFLVDNIVIVVCFNKISVILEWVVIEFNVNLV